jgi:two-component system phosphoglycerate transport system sensor histidine kinase PgtB
MPIKKLKIQPTLTVPEGLYILPTPVILFQKTHLMVWANPAFEKEFGTALTERFVHKANLHVIRERPVTLNIFSMIGRHEGFVMDTRINTKVPVELKVTQYGDASEECFLIMVEDVSSKIELEKQLIQNHIELQKAFEQLKVTQGALIQAGKLASLGELSSGIAHELNQPLQAIMGFSQELQHMEKLSETGTEFLGDIVGASKKMAEIIRSLRSFAREAGEELSATSVDEAVREAVKLMKHQLMSKGIDIEVACDENLPMVTANPIQLEQVMMNIIANARDAIEQAKRTQGKIKVQISNGAESILVKVVDNGCGMDSKTKEKIFDPFFTTKEVGQGTGLGMSISYGILKKIKAEIKVDTVLDQGSEFTITIPSIKRTQGEPA